MISPLLSAPAPATTRSRGAHYDFNMAALHRPLPRHLAPRPRASRLAPRASRLVPRASRLAPRASRLAPRAPRLAPRLPRLCFLKALLLQIRGTLRESFGEQAEAAKEGDTYIHTYITLHYITLYYITLHYITLHHITLRYITLHYITYIHT